MIFEFSTTGRTLSECRTKYISDFCGFLCRHLPVVRRTNTFRPQDHFMTGRQTEAQINVRITLNGEAFFLRLLEFGLLLPFLLRTMIPCIRMLSWGGTQEERETVRRWCGSHSSALVLLQLLRRGARRLSRPPASAGQNGWIDVVGQVLTTTFRTFLKFHFQNSLTVRIRKL